MKLPGPFFWLITLVLGVAIGLSVYAAGQGRLFGTDEDTLPPLISPSAISSNAAIGTNTQVPYWLGFYNFRLWERAPITYCLQGAGWSQEDRDAAIDGFETLWGWAKVNRTIATAIQERCDEGPRLNVVFKMDSSFVQTYCQPGASFVVVACVSFEDWVYVEGHWMYRRATVHVEPYHWNRMMHAWRELILIHEFGHAAMSLDDTPAQQPGVTVMDYTYEASYGLLAYPRDADIWVVDALHGSYKDPAWHCWFEPGNCNHTWHN